MPYITEDQLANQVSVPVALPLTSIKRNDWLILSTILLSTNQKITFKYLQVQLIASSLGLINCEDEEASLINPSSGLVFVAIYKDFVITAQPQNETFIGTAADFIQVDTVEDLVQRDTSVTALEITEVGNYSFVLVNNTSNAA